MTAAAPTKWNPTSTVDFNETTNPGYVLASHSKYGGRFYSYFSKYEESRRRERELSFATGLIMLSLSFVIVGIFVFIFPL